MGGETSSPIKRLGTWVARVRATVYQAETDGYVTGHSNSAANGGATIDTDSANPPTVPRFEMSTPSLYGAACLVKKGDYYEITSTHAGLWYWIPYE